MVEPFIDIINDLYANIIHVIINHNAWFRTVRNIRLISLTDLPKVGSRSDHLLGYASRLNIMSSASDPVLKVFWTHWYFAGICSAFSNRSKSLFLNLHLCCIHYQLRRLTGNSHLKSFSKSSSSHFSMSNLSPFSFVEPNAERMYSISRSSSASLYPKTHPRPA